MDYPHEAGSSSSNSHTSRKRKHETAIERRDEDAKVKSAKACLNCRKQKMRCELEGDPPCRRCKNSNTPCLFKVRANGIEAGDWYISDLNASPDDEFKKSILTRLHAIESKLGITPTNTLPIPQTSPLAQVNHVNPRVQGGVGGDDSLASTPRREDADELGKEVLLPDLWTPLGALVEMGGEGERGNRAWDGEIVEALWLSFAEHMPALHFSTHRIFTKRPTPLLLSSVLYAASMQNPLPSYASLSTFYRIAASRAIAQLAIPASTPIVYSEVQDLHDALGIIITGLLSEAWVDTVGVWISMAWMLILKGAGGCEGVERGEWKGLYEGLRVVDIEHASLRMTTPILPLTPPLHALEQTYALAKPSTRPSSPQAKQAWTHLTTVMHVGLSHFAGRKFPTVLDTVLGTAGVKSGGGWAGGGGEDRGGGAGGGRGGRAGGGNGGGSAMKTSVEDERLIKGWANELDGWLLRYHKPSRSQQRGPSEANVILLQYQLHKLFVLSIYRSARNGNSNYPIHTLNTSRMDGNGVNGNGKGKGKGKGDGKDKEKGDELMAAARGALRLQRMGMAVWSNWDLVLITLAALIVIENSRPEDNQREDRLLVQGHINALRTTHQPSPNLRSTMAQRLEDRFQAVYHQPPPPLKTPIILSNGDWNTSTGQTQSHRTTSPVVDTQTSMFLTTNTPGAGIYPQARGGDYSFGQENAIVEGGDLGGGVKTGQGVDDLGLLMGSTLQDTLQPFFMTPPEIQAMFVNPNTNSNASRDPNSNQGGLMGTNGEYYGVDVAGNAQDGAGEGVYGSNRDMGVAGMEGGDASMGMNGDGWWTGGDEFGVGDVGGWGNGFGRVMGGLFDFGD